MSDRSSESRVLSLVQESYNSGSPEDLRHLEEREYVMRLKQDIEQRQLAYAYRSKVDKDDPAANYVTLQTSPTSDGVEYVSLDEFFVADANTVYEQIIPPHSPHHTNQNETQNGLANYMSQTEVQNGGCIIQLEPVLPSHLSTSSYVHLPTEPIPYDSTMPESRVHYMDGENGDSGSQQDGQQNRCTIQNGIGNHPVPIQIVRPQQLLKTNRSKSLSLCEDLRYSASGSRNEPGHQSPSPPNASRISTRNRKRGNRTASLGSSSDEGSLMNLSMSSSDGRTAEDHLDEEGNKHRRSKQPVPDSNKDEKYWRRREKNNLAAKRSREARKQKENQTTERAAFLEDQHERLKKTLEDVQRQNEELRQRLSKYENLSDLPKMS